MGLFLFLPALLGLGALTTAWLSPPQRKNLLRGLAAAGAGSSLALLLLRDQETTWREVTLGSGLTPVVAAGGAVAFLLCAALVARRVEIVVGTGVAVSSLALAAGSAWAAPFVLFWLASSAGLLLAWRRRPQALAAVALSDALVVGAVALGALGSETWTLEPRSAGWRGALVLAAALVRVGAVPGVGIWDALKGSEAALLPVSVAGGFVLLIRWEVPAARWVAAALLAGALICGLALALRSPRQLSLAGAWATTSMAAIAVAAGSPQPRAALAACIAVGVVAAWSRSEGRAGAERGFVLSFVLGTTAFGSITAAAVLAFDSNLDGEGPDAWAALATVVLLTLLLATGVKVGASVGAARERERFTPLPVIATWVLFGATVVLGLTPSGAIGVGTGSRTLVLMVVAGLAGAVAAWWFRGHPYLVARSAEVSAAPAVAPTSGVVGRALRVVTTLIGVALVVGTGVFVVAGLRVGFL